MCIKKTHPLIGILLLFISSSCTHHSGHTWASFHNCSPANEKAQLSNSSGNSRKRKKTCVCCVPPGSAPALSSANFSHQKMHSSQKKVSSPLNWQVFLEDFSFTHTNNVSITYAWSKEILSSNSDFFFSSISWSFVADTMQEGILLANLFFAIVKICQLLCISNIPLYLLEV